MRLAADVDSMRVGTMVTCGPSQPKIRSRGPSGTITTRATVSEENVDEAAGRKMLTDSGEALHLHQYLD
jgi:hypothetical protein